MYSAKTSAWYNDIELLNKTYYLSSIILKENHKPIHVSRSLGKIEAEFGILIEPAVGILKQISQLPIPEPWHYYYHNSNFTQLIGTKKGELIFSQGFPYRLIKDNTEGKILKETRLVGHFPQRLMTGKLAYRVVLNDQGKDILHRRDEDIVIRFKSPVSTAFLLAHVLAIFTAMLF